MGISVRHKKQSDVPDQVTDGLIKPSEWNDEHLINLDYRLVTGADEIGEDDRGTIIVLNSATALALSIKQPGEGGECKKGWFCFVQGFGLGTGTITPTAGTINAQADLKISQGQWAIIVSNGSTYQALRARDNLADMLRSVYDPDFDGIIDIAQGGTGASTAAGARVKLQLGSLALQNVDSVAIAGGTGSFNTLGVTSAPVIATDVVNKAYAENLAAGLDIKQSVKAASVANVNLASAPSSLDTVTGAVGDRWLLKNQTAPAENGLYIFQGAAVALIRTDDMNAWSEVPGACLIVEDHATATNANKGFVAAVASGGTLGTTAINFSQFFGTGLYQASSALLTAIAALSIVADSFIYGTGTGTVGVATVTSFGRSLMAASNTAAFVPAAGLGTAATKNVGTSAGNVVQLDPSTGKLPAVDGSLLTNLPGASLPDTDRRNALLTSSYLSKMLGFARRGLGYFADGFSASDGINTGASSNYSQDGTNKRVLPSNAAGTVTTVGGNPPALGPTGGWTNNVYISETSALPNNVTIQSIGMYADVAATLTMKIVLKNSSSSVDVVVSQSLSHPGGGWADVVLTTPFTVPASGSYYVGAHFAANPSIKYNGSATGFVASGNVTGAGVGVTEYVGNLSLPSFRATQVGAPQSMTLVTASQTADANVSNARGLLEIDNSAAPTLNTDLIVELTCNGGTNWSSATLAQIGRGQSGRIVVETADTACTAGTSFAARIKTANNKMIPIHGVAIVCH